MFIIKAVNSDNTLYMGIDEESGGYPYFSKILKSATVFKERDDAEAYLVKEMSRTPYQMSDGTTSVNSFLHQASETNIHKMEDDVVFTISEIKVVDTDIKYDKFIQLST